VKGDWWGGARRAPTRPIRRFPATPFGRRFSSFVPHSGNYGGQAGRLPGDILPGLKLWAILLDYFVVSISRCPPTTDY
jgi:hypothetical protein